MRRIAGTRKKGRDEEAAKNENQDSARYKKRRAKIQATGFGFRVTGVLADRYIKPIF